MKREVKWTMDDVQAVIDSLESPWTLDGVDFVNGVVYAHRCDEKGRNWQSVTWRFNPTDAPKGYFYGGDYTFTERG